MQKDTKNGKAKALLSVDMPLSAGVGSQWLLSVSCQSSIEVVTLLQAAILIPKKHGRVGRLTFPFCGTVAKSRQMFSLVASFRGEAAALLSLLNFTLRPE